MGFANQEAGKAEDGNEGIGFFVGGRGMGEEMRFEVKSYVLLSFQ